MALSTYPSDADALVKALRIPPPPGSPYSLPIPNSEKKDRTAVYRHWRFVDQPLLASLDPKITTAHEAFEATVKKVPHKKCLGSRDWNAATKTFGPYEWLTYAQVAERRKNFGAGIVALHKKVGVTDEKYGVGLWCQNRPEWQISDLGCMSQSLFTVSIYDTLGPDTTEYIINHASLVCVITSLPHVATLLKLASAKRIPTLKLIVCLDPLDAGEKPGYSKLAVLNDLAKEAGVAIHQIEDVEALGAASNIPFKPPQPSDNVTINYTSGTTGNPKGVVLTHANAVAGTATARVTTEGLSSDVMISYLPLAHIYQRVGEHCILSGGAAVGYFRGDILGLVDDMKLLKPSVFNSVPRLYNRFGSAIRTQLEAPGLKGSLGRHVINTKLANMKLPNGQASNTHAFYDRIFTKKLRAAFGLERTRNMVSGSAPIDPTLHQYLRAAFGNQFIQGYGLTETYAVSLGQLPGDFSAGNCGAVGVSMEACLQSVPDMEYLVTDKPNPRGELLLRGLARFKEYYKNEAETKKAIDEDGWFRTGDIAEIDSLGRFKIIDRVKNVLKLAQGEYVSPERIENVYLANTNILAQAYVHGDSTQAFLVSVFGVDPVTFAPFASKVLGKTISPTDLDAVKAAGKDEKVKKAVLHELEKIGKKNKFNSWERVRKVHLELEPFTIDNELLTPTLKLKRPQTAKKFRAELDRMYEEALREETPKAKL